MNHRVICPYCNEQATLASSVKIYGRDYGMMYICKNYPACDSYVGVHTHNNEPLGRLANRELREWKIKAHAAFDPLWQKKLAKRRKEKPHYKKSWARNSGYQWLASVLGLEKDDCHIAMFDIEQCKRVIEVCRPYLKCKI